MSDYDVAVILGEFASVSDTSSPFLILLKNASASFEIRRGGDLTCQVVMDRISQGDISIGNAIERLKTSQGLSIIREEINA
ncbi:MAG: hypothetical protein IPO08_20345 [Xanthomonadales bacterium]|nr:hypothetical protein [Xanthomonadales bacterium]